MTPENWKSTEMLRAERDLDEALSKASAQLAAVDEHFRSLEATRPRATPDQIEALVARAYAPDAPPEWIPVRRRVEAGELTWQDIAEGRLLSDPDVFAAMRAGTDPVPVEEFDENDFSRHHTVVRDW